MKKLGVAGGILLVFCALVFAMLHVIFLNSHRQAYHKGALIGAESFTHTFRLSNYSWRALELGDVSSSCGCTVVGDLPETIPPFRSLYVPISINLSGRSGAFQSKVAIDMKPYGLVELEVTADIYPMLPDVIEAGSVRKGAKIDKKFAVPAAFAESPLDESSDVVTARLVTIEGQPIVQLTAYAPNDGGDFEIPVFSGADTPIVRGYVQREIESQLSSISMGYLRPGADAKSPATEQARFISPYGSSFRWRPDLTRHSEFVSVTEVASDVGTAVSVRMTPPPDRGVYREVIDFHFELTDGTEIVRVPVEIYAYVMSEAS